MTLLSTACTYSQGIFEQLVEVAVTVLLCSMLVMHDQLYSV